MGHTREMELELGRNRGKGRQETDNTHRKYAMSCSEGHHKDYRWR